MKFIKIIIFCLSAIAIKTGAQELAFVTGDPVRFIEPAFLYQNTISTAPVVTRADTGEKATVRNSYFYKRDIRSNYHPVNNPNVFWVDVRLERTPAIFGSFPVEPGNTTGPVLADDIPTGNLPPPTLSPSPTTIKPTDLITVTILPTISHHISFEYNTQVRRTGSGEAFEDVGGTQTPEYETGKQYNRFFRLPDTMTVDLAANLQVDLKTIISFNGTEIASQENTGAILVLAPPPPVLKLLYPHFDAAGDFFATLVGDQQGKKYWLESSGDLFTWRRRFSVTGTGNPQSIFLPIGSQKTQYYRVNADLP